MTATTNPSETPTPPQHHRDDDGVVGGTTAMPIAPTEYGGGRIRRRKSRTGAAGFLRSLSSPSDVFVLITTLLLVVVGGANGGFLPSGTIRTVQFSRSYPQQHKQQHQQQQRWYDRHSTTSLEQRWQPSHATLAPTYNGDDRDDPNPVSSAAFSVSTGKKEQTSMPSGKKQATKGGGGDDQQEASLVTSTSAEGNENNNLDALHARAGKLRRSILKQQMELQQLERKIMCCYNSEQPNTIHNLIFGDDYMYSNDIDDVRGLMALAWTRATQTFWNSGGVLWRKLQRVRGNVGVNNERWNGSVGQFMAAQSQSGARIVEGVLKNQTQLLQLMDPNTPTLIAHVPAIVARLDKLESHMATILERVLNNQRHLASIEPYLDEILERFDDIEPHLPWILDHIDTLAPYTGLLLKHIDELLPYAQLDDDETLYGADADTKYQYALAEQLLPYLEFYVSRLDTVGPHLPLLRPHVPKLLKHNRIAKMSPHIDKLFALGYKDDLGASANMDVLLFWFGWALRIPGLPRLFFAIPGSPRLVTFLANRLPKRFVRGYCSGISCTVDEYQYGNQWNKLSKK